MAYTSVDFLNVAKYGPAEHAVRIKFAALPRRMGCGAVNIHTLLRGGPIFRRLQHVVAGALLVLVFGGTAHAQTAPQANVSTYVSDEFKTVATQVFSQLTSDALKGACPKGSPSCVPVAQALGDAFKAALSKDAGATKSALSDFFVTSSIAALVQIAGDIVPPGADETWTLGLRPLFNCVIQSMSGKVQSKVCTMSADTENRGWATALLKSLSESNLGPQDQAAVRATWQVLGDGKGSLDPSQVLRTLAALASSPQVGRIDLRVYLLALDNWVSQGLSDGLFRATYQYLSGMQSVMAADAEGQAALAFRKLIETQGGGGLFGDPGKNWPDVAKSCAPTSQGASPVAGMQAWISQRDAYLVTLQKELRQGLPLDLGPLDQIVSVTQHCPLVAKEARQVHRWGSYMLAALQVQKLRAEYGVVALSVAALIDYVRSGDEAHLLMDLEGLLLYASARLAVSALNSPAPAQPTFTSIEAVLRSCEYQVAELALGLPVARETTGKCAPLTGGAVQAQPTTPTSVDGVITSIRQGLQALLDKAHVDQSLTKLLSDARVTSLEQAGALLQSGDKSGAERLLLRFGVDELGAQIDSLASKFLGTTDEECRSSARRTWIVTPFTSGGATCALHVLLKSAYQPIAEYYLSQGQTQQDTSQLATAVYKDLASTSYLASTPLILNVGLGANSIFGSSDYWGNGGHYTALTVVDKAGLALFKYNATRFHFETGLFVGGFLDALVRTVAGTSQKYWLAGYTVGLPRMFGADFGVEAHVAAVMPFSLNSNNQYGVAVGGALVVPFDLVLH